MSIADLREKIKQIPEEVFIVFIIIAVALTSFALGRYSKEEGSTAQVLYPEEVVKRAERGLNEEVGVIASARGSKYYYPWCSGAENLSKSNIIEFKSGREAESAGYSLATNCDGLNQ